MGYRKSDLQTCAARNAEDTRREALHYAERASLLLDDVFIKGLEPDSRPLDRAREALGESRRALKMLKEYVRKLDDLKFASDPEGNDLVALPKAVG